MAEITKAIERDHRLVAHLIPTQVLKAIGQDELYDRLVHVRELVRKSETASDPTLRKGYRALAQAVLTAQPRAVTQRQVAAKIAKAAGMPDTPQAAAIRREAGQVLERHPIAPRREDAVGVAKAKGDDPDLVPVYDNAGNLIGVVDPAELTPVSSVAEAVAKGVPHTYSRNARSRAAACVCGRAPRHPSHVKASGR